MPLVWLDFSETIAPPARSIVLASCDAGLGAGACAEAEGRPGDAQRGEHAYEASVLQLKELSYRVELHAEDGSRTFRVIDFSAQDPARQRFEAIGLVVSSLTRSLKDGSRLPRPTTPATTKPRAPARPRHLDRASVQAAARLSADAGLALGTGLGRGVDRYGFLLRASYAPWRQGLLFGASLRHQFRVGEPRARWQSLGMGAGVAYGSPFRAEFYGEIVVERFQVSAERAGASESSALLRTGGRAGANVVLELGASLQLVLGGTLQYLRPAVSVGVAGTPVGAVSAFGGEGILALGASW